MKKIKCYIVEIFNGNNNSWEWCNVERVSEYTEKQARKTSYADFMGIDYIEGDIEDIEYFNNNWEENTRLTEITI